MLRDIKKAVLGEGGRGWAESTLVESSWTARKTGLSANRQEKPGSLVLAVGQAGRRRSIALVYGCYFVGGGDDDKEYIRKRM